MSGTLREGRRAGTWELRVAVGRDPLTGKYRQISRTVSGSRREAQNALAALSVEVAQGGHAGSAGDVTVNELLAQWLDLVQDRLSPTTMTAYRGYARRYLAAGFGR